MNPFQIFQPEHKELRYNRVDHGSPTRVPRIMRPAAKFVNYVYAIKIKHNSGGLVYRLLLFFPCAARGPAHNNRPNIADPWHRVTDEPPVHPKFFFFFHITSHLITSHHIPHITSHHSVPPFGLLRN